MEELKEQLRDLVIANRILAREGVVDAFGHVTIRHPNDPERYFMSRSRAPELITMDDILEFRLDGDPIDLRGMTPYGERFIHGAVYEKNPEVQAVIHNHAYELIPYTITDAKLMACCHVASPIGLDIPTWDIRDNFGDTDMLVINMDQGRDLAETLGARTVALMRGHGCVVSGPTLKNAVMTAIYLMINARIQSQAMQLGNPQFLSQKEAELCQQRQTSPLGLDRAWEYWVMRAGCADM